MGDLINGLTSWSIPRFLLQHHLDPSHSGHVSREEELSRVNVWARTRGAGQDCVQLRAPGGDQPDVTWWVRSIASLWVWHIVIDSSYNIDYNIDYNYNDCGDNYHNNYDNYNYFNNSNNFLEF